MGLDMYLSVRKYVQRFDFSGPIERPLEETGEFRDLVKASGMHELVGATERTAGVGGGSIELPVFYWRKANAIHKYIVDTYANGEDHCQEIPLSVEALNELRHKCELVQELPEEAGDILPTENGFFFGSTDYDEYYYGEAQRTAKGIEQLLKQLSKEQPVDIIYQASW